jgi:hypothetical protein
MERLPSTLLICCGTLAREITALVREQGWNHMRVTCLPAHIHNTPKMIPEAVRGKIHEARGTVDKILVLFSDCGTGGELAAVLREEEVESIGGAHCYEIFAGTENFAALMRDEPGSFFLTDFLVRHFDRLIVAGLGLDRFPKLRATYFGHYHKLVYLAQRDDGDLQEKARAAACALGLEYEMRLTGYGDYHDFLARNCG